MPLKLCEKGESLNAQYRRASRDWSKADADKRAGAMLGPSGTVRAERWKELCDIADETRDAFGDAQEFYVRHLSSCRVCSRSVVGTCIDA